MGFLHCIQHGLVGGLRVILTAFLVDLSLRLRPPHLRCLSLAPSTTISSVSRKHQNWCGLSWLLCWIKVSHSHVFTWTCQKCGRTQLKANRRVSVWSSRISREIIRSSTRTVAGRLMPMKPCPPWATSRGTTPKASFWFAICKVRVMQGTICSRTQWCYQHRRSFLLNIGVKRK